MTRQLPLTAVHPTQLCLSSKKLAAVCDWFDFDAPTYDPLPAFVYDEQWYLADGHTRAFAAALAGADHLQIDRDRDIRETHDFEVYRRCIEWCAAAGVETIHDLTGRVVEPATYETQWVDRCQQIADRADK